MSTTALDTRLAALRDELREHALGAVERQLADIVAAVNKRAHKSDVARALEGRAGLEDVKLWLLQARARAMPTCVSAPAGVPIFLSECAPRRGCRKRT